MQLFYENGLPIPKIYHSKDGNLYEHDADGKPYMVMDFADGEMPHDFTVEMVRRVGNVMGKMHVLAADFDYPHERAWPGSLIEMAKSRSEFYLEKYGTQTSEVHVNTRDIIREFEDAASNADLSFLPKGAIHGDIMDENIKFSDGKLTGIFDFDDPRSCIFGTDGQNAAEFLYAYESARPLMPQEKAILPLFYQARIVSNIIRYFRKVDEGKPGYRERIPLCIERYKQFERFFKL